MAAAKEAKDDTKNKTLPVNVTHFFIRQEGQGSQKPPWAENMILSKSYGPFRNIGGGDVPKGDKTYIDFYQEKK